MNIKSIAIVSVLALCCYACSKPESRPEQKTSQTPSPQPRTVPVFDGTHAFSLLEKQVAFGPRVFETPAHDACLKFMVDELQETMDHVEQQTFTEKTYEGGEMHLTNVIASFNPDKTQRVMLCAHWDSRPQADQETDPAKMKLPIAAANDGASGVAVLLEIAHIIKQNPPPIGVDIVLFDGEDYGRSDELNRYCLGSKYFAKHLPSGFHAQIGILLDLVGDRDAVFTQDPASIFFARDVVNDVWAAARRANVHDFVETAGKDILDDHIALNNVGIRSIDIIDADLIGNKTADPRRSYWHTLRDTPENCSATTLANVGNTLLQYIFAEPTQQ